MRDAFERLRLTAEAEERFALEIEQVLLADVSRVRHVAAGHDVRQRAADARVVFTDTSGARGQMNADVERGFERRAANRDCGPKRRPSAVDAAVEAAKALSPAGAGPAG